MASIKVIYRTARNRGLLEGTLFIRIIHDRKLREIETNYHVYPEEWDSEKKCIILPETYSFRVQHLIETDDNLQDDLRRLSAVINLLEEYGSYTVDDIIQGFQVKPKSSHISAYVKKLSAFLVENGQDRTARAYRTVANQLMAFNGFEEIGLEEINTSFLRKYEAHMKEAGKTMNTISFYMRNLRSIYNRAIKDNLIPIRYDNPFKEVYTGLAPTRKRALTKEEMHILSELELSIYEPKKRFPFLSAFNIRKHAILKKQMTADLRAALAMFMFCFHARGMSFVDMAYLRKKNISRDEISYCRKKTGKNMRIKITPPMQFIIDYFEPATRTSPYVFPIIIPGNGRENRQYEYALQEQNKLLKIIGEIAGINKLISTHVARHSWATIARMEHIPISIISEALGHRDEKTTTIYLDSFNDSVIDRVSEQISRIVH
ncbi:transposase [Bacteroidia bacterium]|nr:transposase [Bacteroidia bacterium]